MTLGTSLRLHQSAGEVPAPRDASTQLGPLTGGVNSRYDGIMDRTYTYTVRICRTHGGSYFAIVPMLPECIAQGDTYEDALRNVTDSIRSSALELTGTGREIPIEPDQFELRIQVQLPGTPRRT